MKFKQFQHVKQTAYNAFMADAPLASPTMKAALSDSLNLALVGDAYYALMMRRHLLKLGIPHVRVLHALAAEFVSARAQAFVYEEIKMSYGRRGNALPPCPQHGFVRAEERVRCGIQGKYGFGSLGGLPRPERTEGAPPGAYDGRL